jgi:hypothetical protein
MAMASQIHTTSSPYNLLVRKYQIVVAVKFSGRRLGCTHAETTPEGLSSEAYKLRRWTFNWGKADDLSTGCSNLEYSTT